MKFVVNIFAFASTVLAVGAACTEGDIRLMDGPNDYEGRVEVCHNNLWGTVCDGHWGVDDGIVACRQLGHEFISVTKSASYGQGRGRIWLNDVSCTGSENRLIDCPHSSFGSRRCSHSQDAGLVCYAETNCTEGEIRLVGTAGDYDGDVIICHLNTWGHICSYMWDTNDGTVACRQLGLEFVGVTPSSYHYGQGRDLYLVGNLNCTGSESRLTDCGDNLFSINSCSYSKAGLACDVEANCTEGDIRLLDGPDNFEGRVEICHNNLWGTVCDNYWNANSGIVACRQLGLSLVRTTTSAYYGKGRGHIWLDNLSCKGSETRLIDCYHNGFDASNCGHSHDVGVVCNNATSCSEGDIRLLGGVNDYQGHVEICHLSIWNSLCSSTWDKSDGIVACHQLGLEFMTIPKHLTYRHTYGTGTGQIWLDKLSCTGSETRLTDCAHKEFSSNECRSNYVVNLICTNITCSEGDVRLVGGVDYTKGRVEICHNNEWGSVCDDSWSDNDGIVACHQLGLSFKSVTTDRSYGQGTRQTWTGNVSCTGSEARLIDCIQNGFDSHNCPRGEGAGLVCTAHHGLRLVGGTSPQSGTLMFQLSNGTWGTVCNHGFNYHAARVACKQLGYDSYGDYRTCTNYSCHHSNGPIAVCQTNCDGSEKKLSSCDVHHSCSSSDNYNYDYDYGYSHNPPCTHDDDVTLYCYKHSTYKYHHHHHHHKLSAGAITGITLGVVLLLCTSLIVICVCVRRYRTKQRSPAYVLLHKQHPMIFVADGGSDTESDFKACIPAKLTAVEYTDECSVEDTSTNDSDAGPPPDTTVSNDVPTATPTTQDVV